jgi:hypothetical protein
VSDAARNNVDVSSSFSISASFSDLSKSASLRSYLRTEVPIFLIQQLLQVCNTETYNRRNRNGQDIDIFNCVNLVNVQNKNFLQLKWTSTTEIFNNNPDFSMKTGMCYVSPCPSLYAIITVNSVIVNYQLIKLYTYNY